jgi:two-component system sensor histidine kinase UhpB
MSTFSHHPGIEARRPCTLQIRRRKPLSRQFSTFEKVIVANSVIIILDTAAGWWITQHNPETYHYLIDTSFIALAALLGIVVNFALLRAAFAPLRNVLATLRAIERGDLDARVDTQASDADALALARAFNDVLDRLALARDDAAARVLRAQEEERRRVALELHDQTGQSLTALALHAEVIAQRLADDTSDAATQARAQATRLAGLVQQTLVEVQTLSRQLRPSVLDDLGLAVALRWLAEDARERLKVDVQVEVRGDEEGGISDGVSARLSEEVETALYRIAQESLTNAVRHGEARQVRVVLRQTATHVTLTLADNGHGFTPSTDDLSRPGGAAWARGRGLGLEGMRERARLLGGALTIRSRPGHGCLVRARVPLHAVGISSDPANDLVPRREVVA